MSIAIRVNGSWVRLLIDWMDQVGLAAPDIRAELSSYGPSDVVPLERWQNLLERAFSLRPDKPSASLDVARLITPQHVGVLGYLIMACDNLGQAMLTYQRYETLFYGAPIARTEANGSTAGIYWTPVPPCPEAEEVAIAALVHFMRQQVDEHLHIPLQAVSFCHGTDEAHRQALERFFGCPVTMNAERTGLCFPPGAMQLPLRQSEPALRELLEAQAGAMLRALPESEADEFERQVQAMLVRMLPDGDAAIERLAPRLHCSVRTLQRRLGERGIVWKQLLDRTREQLAHQYLEDPGLSLLDIALLLGYSDQGAFTRSFRRWSGTTPMAYRKTLAR